MRSNRPLSPHLSIYKKILTSVFSIFHRFTGISLSIGSILIALWFCLFALLPSYYFVFEIISANIFFRFILFIWTITIFYHLFNGVRYLYWSFGIGMDLNSVYFSAYMVLFLTMLSSILVWFLL
ncbi:MAG: hypothetical protein CFH15_00629 [Alphaproteobacteria bacterium MarineAlpha5_Bin5]|nr:MAG: hypothetical protein CFH15_00629 [Alphaproteobacteria bacterium MarineAlpha5_Bin5]PPR52501.1 MAG: hypothetical protein CFH14_00256 [Alphaproteobacteria bacterium MarineAlpha5_Bin4]|tara:strand:+ start:95 stop:466 length:372 start_codon:yes stop_codon:yes gene_type:complete